MAFTASEFGRIELTASVRDTDAMPKVEGAGGFRPVPGGHAQVMHNGVLVPRDGYMGPWMTEIIHRLRGHHEPQEEPVFDVAIRRLAATSERPRMIELGSHWAYYSAWFATALPDARCLMVEPDPGNLEVGRRTFALNELEGVFLPGAIAERHGSAIRMQMESDGREHEVPGLTIAGLMADQGLERADLVSCDVQGAELDAIEGAVPVIREGRLRFLFVATHHESISGDPDIHRRCRERLGALGAHVIAEHTVEHSCSGDGLIAVSFDPRDRDLHVAPSPVDADRSLFARPAATPAQRVARRLSVPAQQRLWRLGEASALARRAGARVAGDLGRGETTIAAGIAAGLRFDAAGTSPAYALGTAEPRVQTALTEVLEPGMTVCDLGCGAGFHTLVAARLVGPGGRVLAYDASPANVATTRANAERNGFAHVEVRQGDGVAELGEAMTAHRPVLLLRAPGGEAAPAPDGYDVRRLDIAAGGRQAVHLAMPAPIS